MRIRYFLMGLLIFVIAGCVSIPYVNPPRTDETSLEFHIKVTSEPSDAEIYINNMLYGRTPAESLPLTVSCISKKDWFEETIKVTGQYILKVSKKGYKDAVDPLDFNYFWSGNLDQQYRPDLKKTKFHFKLVKEE